MAAVRGLIALLLFVNVAAASPLVFDVTECQRVLTELDLRGAGPHFSEYQSAFETLFRDVQKRNPEVFKNKNDPFIKLLVEAGFRRFPLRVPSLQKIVASYTRLMLEAARLGKVNESEVLMPARIYELNGELVPVLFGDTPPTGAKPHNRILSDRNFWRLVRDGFFPLGENEMLGRLEQGAVLHDLAHLAAFLEHPRFMAAVRAAAADYLATAPFMANGELNRVDRSPSFQVVEGLSLVPYTNRPALIQLLELPRGALTVATLKTYYGAFSRRELDRYKAKLRQELPGLVAHYGGSAYDPVIRAHGEVVDGHVFEPSNFADAYFVIEQRALKFDDRVKWSAEARDNELDALARLHIYLIESTGITAQQWVRALLTPKDKLSKDDPVRRFVCESGAWVSYGWLHLSVCD